MLKHGDKINNLKTLFIGKFIIIKHYMHYDAKEIENKNNIINRLRKYYNLFVIQIDYLIY